MPLDRHLASTDRALPAPGLARQGFGQLHCLTASVYAFTHLHQRMVPMLHAPRLRVALTILLVTAVPAVVSAARHLKLVKSQPAANATLESAPAQVQLWFSQLPQVTVTRLTLVPAAGKPVVLSPVTRADGANEPVVAPVPSGLAAGKWTLRWRTVAKDGHPVKGEIPFTIAAAAAR